MAACMTDTWKCIILGVKGHDAAIAGAMSIFNLECRFQAIGLSSNSVALIIEIFEEFADILVSIVLLVSKFRIGPDLQWLDGYDKRREAYFLVYVLQLGIMALKAGLNRADKPYLGLFKLHVVVMPR
jgi:hypothetical protein